jgi:hypothetical protein
MKNQRMNPTTRSTEMVMPAIPPGWSRNGVTSENNNETTITLTFKILNKGGHKLKW